MLVHVIEASYDSGAERRMGRGPRRLIERGLLGRLTAEGHVVAHTRVRLASEDFAEGVSTFALHRAIGGAVNAARERAEFPIVLSGNCNAGVIGLLAGRQGEAVGVLWLDAHADSETPATTQTGFLDGMGVAMLTGRCWSAPLQSISNFRPLQGRQVILLGARELGSVTAQRANRTTGVTVMEVERYRAGALATAFADWQKHGIRAVHLHIDVDVLDSEEVGKANDYALPGGLQAAELLDIIEATAREFPIVAASMASFDPDSDPSSRVAEAATAALAALACKASL